MVFLLGLIILGVLVFIHELGHCLAARWQGIHVRTFSVGFGPAILSWRDRKRTCWQISLIPLGGYVRLEDDKVYSDSVSRASILSRAIVTIAGPAFNVLCAIVLFAVIFSHAGKLQTGQDIAFLVQDGPAMKAGLRLDDRIAFVGGQKILSGPSLIEAIEARPGETVTLGIIRNGKDMDLPVTLLREKNPLGDKGRIGAAFSIERSGPMPVLDAITQSVSHCFTLMGEMYQMIWAMLTGHMGGGQLSGVIGISHVAGKAVEAGFVPAASLAALLSLNLCVMNLLPLPILDGGGLLFLTIEAIRGRPLSEKTMAVIAMAGALLLGMVFLYSTFGDIISLTGHNLP